METKETNGTGRSVALEIARPVVKTAISAYEPSNFMDAMKIAETLAKSKMFGVASAEAAFVIMSTGADLGLSPTAALRSIFTVNGRPGLSADLMVALCLKSPECEYFRCVESTADKATYAAKRFNNPERKHSWTIDQAKRANLANKDVWKAYPEDMLRHRAAAPLARELFPNLLLGLYCREELEEIAANEAARQEDPAPRPQEVVEGEIIKDDRDPLDAVQRAFFDAKNEDELNAARAAAARLGLKKDSDEYKALRQLDKDAEERIGK